jgi:hypothetical protein
MSGFLGCDPLLSGVVAALRTDAVRSLGSLATRALLEDDRRRGFMRIARALFALGGSSFRYGHGSR